MHPVLVGFAELVGRALAARWLRVQETTKGQEANDKVHDSATPPERGATFSKSRRLPRNRST